jgi:cytoskeletal protein RodZ
MKTLGEKLRSQRLAKGIQLSRIAEETRIGARYLEALENDDLKVLPGSLFAKSFARQYARFVGLDESDIEAELGAAFPPENNLPTLESLNHSQPIHVAPLPDVVGASASFSPQIYRSVVALLLVMAACSAVYMGWQRWQVRLAQEDIAPVAPPPAAAPPPEPIAAATEPPPTVASSQSAPSAPAQAITTAPASTESAPANPQNASIDLKMPEGSEGMAVQVVATEQTWVSITVNGRSVFSGMLQPNESRTLSRVERARMVIGNAGGVDVITDGKSIGPIGPPGQVRFVLLSPDGPRILTRREVEEQKNRALEGAT